MKRITMLLLLATLLITVPGCLEEETKLQPDDRFYHAITNASYLQGRHDERLITDQIIVILNSVQKVQGQLYTNQVALDRAQMSLARTIISLTAQSTNAPATNAVAAPTAAPKTDSAP